MTKQTKHTDYEWYVTNGWWYEDDTELYHFSVRYDDDETHHHLTVVEHANKDEAEANAKLIAAAPNMLSALMHAENHLTGITGFREWTPAEAHLYEIIMKAITKATK